MVAQVTWHGTPIEKLALLAALEHNCESTPPEHAGPCRVHAMLLNQKILDGLLFARWLAQHPKEIAP